MRRKLMFRLSLLALVSVVMAAGAMAQTIPMELEVGYRWTNVNGNEDMYRSQINERSGFLVRSFTLSTNDFNGGVSFVDRFRVDVSELGAGPAGFARLDMGKTGVYRLTLGYRITDQFSALPGFANPLLAQGIIPGQHTIDRTRKMFDADLELLPGKAITPFVGYSWNKNSGPGTTTYFLGQDEFRLNQDLKETENEVRVGAGFNFGGVVYGQATQGWRQFKGTENLTLVNGAGAGNNAGPVQDQTISASNIVRNGNTDVNTPFTNINVTAAIAKRLKITGTYIRFNAKQDGLGSESDAGSFVSFQLDRFFSGLTESVSANAQNKTWQGGGRVELGLTEGVDLFGGFNRQHRELSGTSLIDTIYLQSITFGGLDKKDLETLLRTQNSLERQDDVWNVGVSARSVGPLSFRGEYRETDGHTTLTEDLSEIVVGSIAGQGGTLDRRVRTLDGSVTFTKSGFTALVSYKKDQANAPVFRTDFLDRDRFRTRLGYVVPGDLIKVGFQMDQTNQSNDWTGTGFSAKNRQYTGDLEIAPVPALRLRGSVSQFQTDSTIVYRVPQNLNLDTSINTERGDAVEGGLSLKLSPITFDLAAGRFENRGTIPFNIERYRINLGWDIVKQAGIVAEWARDKYREGTPSLGDFDATRFGLYLRWRP
jgi:hypothetical protein